MGQDESCKRLKSAEEKHEPCLMKIIRRAVFNDKVEVEIKGES